MPLRIPCSHRSVVASPLCRGVRWTRPSTAAERRGYSEAARSPPRSRPAPSAPQSAHDYGERSAWLHARLQWHLTGNESLRGDSGMIGMDEPCSGGEMADTYA